MKVGIKGIVITALLIGSALAAAAERADAGSLPVNKLYLETDTTTISHIRWSRGVRHGRVYQTWPAIIGGAVGASAFGPYGGPFIYGVPSSAFYGCGPYGTYYGTGPRLWLPYCY